MPEPLQPECIFGVLADHEVVYALIGGLGAALHGSPALTNDADIVPAAEPTNLERLAAALGDLDARIRTEDAPDGLPFDPHPSLLASITVLHLTTRCGDLDLAVRPSGIDGYDELAPGVVRFEVDGLQVPVAALGDIIRSKEAAGRPKDQAALPVLRALQDEIARSTGTGS